MTDPNEVAETFRPFLAALGHEEIIPAIALAIKDAQREGFAEAMRGNDLADEIRACLDMAISLVKAPKGTKSP